MSVIRMIIIFLLGAGVAIGILASGLADRFPRFAWKAERRLDEATSDHGWDEGHWREHGWRGDDDVNLQPSMIIRLSNSGPNPGEQTCSRVLIVRNNTDQVIAAEVSGSQGNRILVPPSSTVSSSDRLADRAAADGHAFHTGGDDDFGSDDQGRRSTMDYVPPYSPDGAAYPAFRADSDAVPDDAGYSQLPLCPPERIEVDSR